MIFCFFFCKATKLEYGGIPNTFNKTLWLIKNTLFKFCWYCLLFRKGLENVHMEEIIIISSMSTLLLVNWSHKVSH